ncbi:glyoxylase-like metal-dependent hydrolase (beta-lactamase superfamily II) [Actinokineospora baliensis]|uniref:MBL fold metallo-hydrolase n=1 Tax=Actinokineospora baliensis TaxID=547056 RepID=UPI00195CEFB2|nr:MBL fold metallo-hydrolase [Actinokineospora baliensis]MBM7771631.1 glyoxylase-like metal-dependent hydrolase (beta-lactamase superfamily II) [Actinokineospora baliensis]
MRVHHLDCGSMHPPGGGFVDGAPGLLRFAHMVCHVLLVESDDGLVLVDTGFGVRDLTTPKATLPGPFVALVRPEFDVAQAAVRQVAALGYNPADVRHIILTHLDLDHAGGLVDFPDARVHVHGPELRAALTPATSAERQRYRKAHWAHGPKWEVHESGGGDRWMGLESVRGLTGLSDDFRLVPLAGHTRGHVGVAVHSDDGWLLHAGDSYFNAAEMAPTPSCPPGLRVFQSLMQVEGKARKANQERLRTMLRSHRDEVKIFSAHDAAELAPFTR